MEDGLDGGRWTAADKHFGQAQVDVKRYIRPRALPEDSVHETKCRTFNGGEPIINSAVKNRDLGWGDARPDMKMTQRFQFGAEDEAGRDWNSCALLPSMGFTYHLGNEGLKTAKRLFFISLDNFL